MACVLDMRMVKLMIFFAQLSLTLVSSIENTTNCSENCTTTSEESSLNPSGTTYSTEATNVPVSAYTTSDTDNATDDNSTFHTTDNGSSTLTSHTTTMSPSANSSITTTPPSANSSITTMPPSTNSSKVNNPDLCAVNLIVVAVAGGVVILCFIWSIFVYCRYKRKLNRLPFEKKMSAKDSVRLNEMNGRKVSAAHDAPKIDGIDRKFSYDMHSGGNEHEDQLSDTYDVTEPDYEDADAKLNVKVSKKPSEMNNDDEDEEDSQYDVLNIEDENTKTKRSSNYERAEFKTSNEGVDTYDTTETCNRIVCDEEHDRQQKDQINGTEHQSKVTSDCTASEPSNGSQIKTSESNKQVVDSSENQIPVSDGQTGDTIIPQTTTTTTTLNNNESREPPHSGEKAVKTELVGGDKATRNDYEFVKHVETANPENKTSEDIVKNETSTENKQGDIKV